MWSKEGFLWRSREANGQGHVMWREMKKDERGIGGWVGRYGADRRASRKEAENGGGGWGKHHRVISI